ncbi:MAG: potassium-transporting ATPase subunit KdpC [Elsteraceae bacterium]
MLRTLFIACRATLLTAVILGVGYPLAMTGLGQMFFPDKTDGSLIRDARGRVIGSALLAQAATKPHYLQPRPSAAGEGYDAMSSGGSNLGPSSAALRERVKAEIARLQAENPRARGPIPAELVTASASGLDPHLSPAGMLWQLPRIAQARGVAEERVRAVLMANVEDRWFGLLGQPTVNVLQANLALDRQFGPAR